MRRDYFEITLPYQKPQVVEVRLWGGGASRLAIRDKYDRLYWLQGEEVGFGVTVYRMLTQPPRIKLSIFGDYEKALYTGFDCRIHEVPIKKLEEPNEI